MDTLTIGALAQQAHLRPSAIRYYEKIGLLPLPGRVNGKRRYDPNALHRVRLIQLARRAGFTIADVKALLHNFPLETPPSERWQVLAGKKIDELDKFICEALEMKALLAQTLQCHCSTLEECAGVGNNSTPERINVVFTCNAPTA